jgi:hypothetical protein
MTVDTRSAEFLQTATTSLTIHNIPVRLVGVVLALLEEAGLMVEVNVDIPYRSDES